jgi:hypothetical protein
VTEHADTTVTEPDRIAALEAQLAKLTHEHDRKARERVQIEAQTLPSAPKVPPDSFRGELARMQDVERQQRAEVHAEWSAAYEAQLEQVAPECEALNGKNAVLEARILESEASHAATVAQLRAEQSEVRAKCTSLMQPPAYPDVKVDAGVRLHALERVWDLPTTAALARAVKGRIR